MFTLQMNIHAALVTCNSRYSDPFNCLQPQTNRGNHSSHASRWRALVVCSHALVAFCLGGEHERRSCATSIRCHNGYGTWHEPFSTGGLWNAIPLRYACRVCFVDGEGARGIDKMRQLDTAGLPMRSPYNPTYSMGMMQHRALTLNGAANGFITPGFFHPMSDHYPTPDMDRYSSVITHPVLPPDYGHGSGSGSGK